MRLLGPFLFGLLIASALGCFEPSASSSGRVSPEQGGGRSGGGALDRPDDVTGPEDGGGGAAARAPERPPAMTGTGGASSDVRLDAGAPTTRLDAGDRIDRDPLPPQGVWEVDLTTGQAGTRVIETKGGVWDRGWRVASALGERIVWDMGRPIKAGVLEIDIAVNQHPHETPGKINYAGLFERESLDQDDDGDIFYARVGDNKYGFSRAKAAGKAFDMTEWEPSLGSAKDWTVDDATIHTIKFEWKDGVAVFHDAKGAKWACPKSICGGAFPVDELRYVFVGADKWARIKTDAPDHLSAVGMRFVRLRLVDTSPRN